MSLISRYLLREYIKILFLCLAALVMVYLTIEAFEQMRSLIEYRPDPASLLSHFLLKLPGVLFEMLPPAVLMATLFTVGIFSRTNEIMAMRSCGVSHLTIVSSFLTLSAVISLAALLLGNTLVPVSLRQAELIKEVVIKKKKPASFRQDRIWFWQEGRVLYNIQLIDPETGGLYGISIYKLGTDFSFPEVVDARELRYEGDHWVLLSGVRKQFHPGGSTDIYSFDKEPLELDKAPGEFQQSAAVGKRGEMLKYSELKSYATKLKRDGYNAARYFVDLHAKVSFPFANFIMALLGVSLGLQRRHKTSITKGVGISFVLGFLYYFIHSMALALGKSGLLPPLLSAWMANLLFLSTGGILFLRLPH